MGSTQSGQWSILNGSGLTITQNGGGSVVLTTTQAAQGNTNIYQGFDEAIPSGATAYEYQASITGVGFNNGYLVGGMHLRDAAGKISLLGGDYGNSIRVERFNNVTTYNGVNGSTSVTGGSPWTMYFKIALSGGNITYSYSTDASTWTVLTTESATAFSTSGWTNIGIGANWNSNSNTMPAGLQLSCDWFRKTA